MYNNFNNFSNNYGMDNMYNSNLGGYGNSMNMFNSYNNPMSGLGNMSMYNDNPYNTGLYGNSLSPYSSMPNYLGHNNNMYSSYNPYMGQPSTIDNALMSANRSVSALQNLIATSATGTRSLLQLAQTSLLLKMEASNLSNQSQIANQNNSIDSISQIQDPSSSSIFTFDTANAIDINNENDKNHEDMKMP